MGGRVGGPVNFMHDMFSAWFVDLPVWLRSLWAGVPQNSPSVATTEPHKNLHCLFCESMYFVSLCYVKWPLWIGLQRNYSCHVSIQVDFAVGFYRGKGRPLPLFVMIESPRALLHLDEMLKFAVSQLRNVAVQATVFGSDDFIAAMGELKWITNSNCIVGMTTTDEYTSTHSTSHLPLCYRQWS